MLCDKMPDATILNVLPCGFILSSALRLCVCPLKYKSKLDTNSYPLAELI